MISAFGPLIALVVMFGPAVAAAFACHWIHERVYDETGSNATALVVGIIVGIPMGIALAAGPLYLGSIYAQSHGIYRDNDGANVADIFVKLLTVAGAGIGFVFGAGVWRRKRT